MDRRPLLALLGVALVAALLLVGLRAQREARFQERLRLEAATGAVPLYVPAPEVTLLGLDTPPVPLASYRGRVVFVNFWATWCGPCKAELPSLLALHDSLDPRDIAWVAIAEDDTDAPLRAFLQRSPLPFDVFRDRPPRIEDLFETRSYPTSFVIDREGKAIYRFNGAKDWMQPEIRQLLALEGVRERP